MSKIWMALLVTGISLSAHADVASLNQVLGGNRYFRNEYHRFQKMVVSGNRLIYDNDLFLEIFDLASGKTTTVDSADGQSYVEAFAVDGNTLYYAVGGKKIVSLTMPDVLPEHLHWEKELYSDAEPRYRFFDVLTDAAKIYVFQAFNFISIDRTTGKSALTDLQPVEFYPYRAQIWKGKFYHLTFHFGESSERDLVDLAEYDPDTIKVTRVYAKGLNARIEAGTALLGDKLYVPTCTGYSVFELESGRLAAEVDVPAPVSAPDERACWTALAVDRENRAVVLGSTGARRGEASVVAAPLAE